MFPRLFAFTVLVSGIASTGAMADQYVVQIDGPLPQTQDALLSNLQINEIDTFTHDGRHYAVLEAPTEGYLAAYFHAAGRTPISLATVSADWEGIGLDGLTLDRRMLFLTPVDCEFCSP